LCQQENVEIILVDDGSTDETYSILERCEDKRLKIIKKENEGVGIARNLLLDSAKGDYIWFVDADDYIEDGCISDILSLISEKGGADIYTLLYHTVSGRINGRWMKFHKTLYDGSGMKFLSKRDPSIYGYLWNKIYRRDFINEAGVRFDGKLISQEDWLFNMKLMPLAARVVETNIKAYNYYLGNQNSTMHNKNEAHILRNISDSMSTQIEFNHFIGQFRDTRDYTMMCSWRNYAVSGFLYSLLVNKIPIDRIKSYLSTYESVGLYPCGLRSRSWKATLFLVIGNVRSLYLLICRLHLR
jgi:glycosyltransferase involved in cell wall biosynthesis